MDDIERGGGDGRPATRFDGGARRAPESTPGESRSLYWGGALL
ncbi:hypothetical protein [Burkholderia glumae]|nr:hypothetical protein [Burkholderia glumae]